MIIPSKTIIDDRFEIISLLGSGGLGAVYRARQANLNRDVAIKVLHVAVSDDLNEKERLRREAMVLSELNHTNIVAFYGYGMCESFPYLAMEFVEGATLHSLLAGGQPLSFDFTLSVVRQICEALEAAHNLGVVHRDLKPVNILIQRSAADPHVKLIDFGLAKLLPEFGREMQKLTKTGATVGTPLYMSPEQCAGDELDSRTDLYAVGAILYHCLSGAPPFVADDNLVVMMAHLRARPDPLGTLHESSEPYRTSLDRILGRALAKDRQDRYGTAAELLEDLNRVSKGLAPASWQSINDVKPHPFTSKFSKQPNRAQVIGALGLLLVGIIVAAIIKMQVTPAPPRIAPNKPFERDPSAHAHWLALMKGRAARLTPDQRIQELQSLLRDNEKSPTLSHRELLDVNSMLIGTTLEARPFEDGVRRLHASFVNGQMDDSKFGLLLVNVMNARARLVSSSKADPLLREIAMKYIAKKLEAAKNKELDGEGYFVTYQVLGGVGLLSSTGEQLRECENLWNQLYPDPVAEITIDGMAKSGRQIFLRYLSLSNYEKAVEWSKRTMDVLAPYRKTNVAEYNSMRSELAQRLIPPWVASASAEEHRLRQLRLNEALRLVDLPGEPLNDTRVTILVVAGKAVDAIPYWKRQPFGNPRKFGYLAQIARSIMELPPSDRRIANKSLLPCVVAMGSEKRPLDEVESKQYGFILRMQWRMLTDSFNRKDFDTLLSLTRDLKARESSQSIEGNVLLWYMSNAATMIPDQRLSERLRNDAKEDLLSHKYSQSSLHEISGMLWADYCVAKEGKNLSVAKDIWDASYALVQRIEAPKISDLLRKANCEECLEIGDHGEAIIASCLQQAASFPQDDVFIKPMLQQYRRTIECKGEKERLAWFDDALKKAHVKLK